ncbi:MAG: hypothetical protein P4M11_15290 [Candidatus Pacebacteria bacterium]|nr:hypothetical protein [Candidatus Paceibacterota bacterium]
MLCLWKDYYDYRPRDRLSLEFTTKLRFALWIDIATDILRYGSDGAFSPFSIEPMAVSDPPIASSDPGTNKKRN